MNRWAIVSRPLNADFSGKAARTLNYKLFNGRLSPDLPMLAAVKELDERILNEPALGPDLFATLIAAQHRLGLVYGERICCPFLRPHIVTRSQYDSIARAAKTIAGAFEKLVSKALADDHLLKLLGLTEVEERMARIDPGYPRLCVTSRLDAYLTDSGFQFLEYNAENPAGIGDQMQLEQVLFQVPAVADFLREHPHWCPEPHRRLLTALLSTYRDWGGKVEQPQIGIVDWKGVPTESEFRVLQQYFVSQGHATVIADPHELHYDGDRLTLGDFRIDILYKRVVIHELLERLDETHALARAYRNGRICMVNSFRSKVAHKKAGFAILSDPQYEHLFTADEVETIRRHIPWTRRVAAGSTTFEGREHDLPALVREKRDRLVLKPNDDYGGHGVFIGWEMNADEWEQALLLALSRPYVVQERVPANRIQIPAFSDQATMQELLVDFNPFLFNNEVEGALVRLSTSTLLNVSSGGGQTALVVLEDL